MTGYHYIQANASDQVLRNRGYMRRKYVCQNNTTAATTLYGSRASRPAFYEERAAVGDVLQSAARIWAFEKANIEHTNKDETLLLDDMTTV
ncbi:hypothetical protein N7471_004616 [Penicillium samsonianum]|uniref:uncharacterized protein n=1 Tax=Penicillium samsonianum TaxID=1882272 RepID=UPI0025489F0E|nr:uncharacterized protein N7471_004616 [Penicillium samsonianum]KAJ6138130.1 hypothetical protein N7471_004616 [Penicillium samsonianum]